MQPQSYQPQYGAQPAQPGYAAPPQYAMPQPAPAPPQPPVTGANPFTTPTAPGAGTLSPKIYDLEGALVAMSPTAFTAAGTGDNLTGFEGAPPRDRVTTNVFVLETRGNAPLTFGGDKTKGKPDTHTVAGPARFSGVWLSNQNIVVALAPGGQPQVGALILGRIVRSEVGRRPWNLVAVDGTSDMDRALQIWNALTTNQLAYNEPQPIPGMVPQQAPANSVQYVAPAQPGSAFSPYAAPQQGYAAPYQPPAPQPSVDPAYAAWQAQQQVGQQFQPVAPAVPQGPPPPAGWNPQAWAGLDPAQQQQVLSSFAQQSGQMPQTGPGNGNPF